MFLWLASLPRNLHVHFFADGNGDRVSSTHALMEPWLWAEHGALLAVREQTLRGVRAGGGQEGGMESEVQPQAHEKGHAIRAVPSESEPEWVPA